MNRRTFQGLALAAAMLLFSAAPFAQQSSAAQKPTQPADKAQPQKPAAKPQTHEHLAVKPTGQPDMAAKCQEMMKQHEQMMAEQKAADQRLDDLVAKMNSASGQARVDATAAVVNEMVTQRKAMMESMMKMHQGTMAHMMEHMQAGPKSMAMCPMMKMGGQKD
jgi:predicted transcriptional regulator